MNSPKIEEITSNPKGFCASHFKKHYPEWIEYIKRNFPAPKLIESAYQYFYGPAPICPECGKPTVFLSFFRGYTTYCSQLCMRKSAATTEKTRQTKLERYGDPGYNNMVKNRATKKERYGDEYFLNPQKRKQTCIERYGVSNVFENLDIRQKIKQTCIERYGVENVSYSPEIVEKIIKGRRVDTMQRHDFLIGYDEHKNWICKCPHDECSRCQTKQYVISPQHQLDRMRLNCETCTILNPINSQESSLELFITRLLDKWNIKYEKNRSILHGKELDIYIPTHKIAIECNGTYWHSTECKDKKYHIQKCRSCLVQGIQLIQIWEDWIIKKPQIVESMLQAKLGICNRTIYARRCHIKSISSKVATNFLIENHIQGRCNATIHLGLFNGFNLVAVMCFSKRSKLSGSKHPNATEWELIRFCNLRNYRVVGGAGKLLSHFIKSYFPSIITSFSSNDISSGQLYKSLGFETDGKIRTSYYYIKDLIRYHRTSFTKSSIVARGWKEQIDNSWTEREVMREHRYLTIYDSGTIKWQLCIKKEAHCMQ